MLENKCTFPNCHATVVVNAYKETVNSLKDELRIDLHALHEDQKLILEAIQSQGVLQATLSNLCRNFDKALEEHEQIFNRLRDVEATVRVNSNRISVLETGKKEGLAWFWDILKLGIAALIGAIIAKVWK